MKRLMSKILNKDIEPNMKEETNLDVDRHFYELKQRKLKVNSGELGSLSVDISSDIISNIFGDEDCFLAKDKFNLNINNTSYELNILDEIVESYSRGLSSFATVYRLSYRIRVTNLTNNNKIITEFYYSAYSNKYQLGEQQLYDERERIIKELTVKVHDSFVAEKGSSNL